jgi:hypothetical protein
MGKQKRKNRRPEAATTPPLAPLCGCNPDVVAQVIILVGRNKEVLARATERLDADPYVALMMESWAAEKPSQLYKECVGMIPHLAVTLRELADTVEECHREIVEPH